MSLNDELELSNTRAKLARLEARHAVLASESGGDEELREMTMESLMQTINQFKEEIARYEAGGAHSNGSNQDTARRRVLSDLELANTRRKLSELERMYAEGEQELDDDELLRETSMESLKRLINQLKEEIIWTEVHQPAQR